MEQSNWSKISNEISDVSKKIKNKIDEQDLVDDLKQSFGESVESASDILKKIITTIETTISDEDIKKQTKEVIFNINNEFELLIDSSKKTLNNFVKSDLRNEEE